MDNHSKKVVAIAYDFDGTLAPGNMQERSFIPQLNIDKGEFWQEANTIAEKHDMDEILAYMHLMLKKAGENNLPITRKAFLEHGNQIRFFEGVEAYFDRINTFAGSLGLALRHYIISSGLRDIIQGTFIAKHFTNVFASGFAYDANEVAFWPALAINYTNKTQYLFRINKGIENSWDNSKINKYTEMAERPVPFERMVYVGDGLTDVPAMKMIKYQGGFALAVYDPDIPDSAKKPSLKQLCEALIKQNRADFIAAADYREGKRLDNLMQAILKKIAAKVDLDELSNI